MTGGKTAILQKSHLPCPACGVCRHPAPKTLLPYPGRALEPFSGAHIDTLLGEVVLYSALAQLVHDAHRAISVFGTVVGKRFGEARVALQAVPLQLEEQSVEALTVEAPLAQLAPELTPAVLPPCQQAQGGSTRVVFAPAQVSASSATDSPLGTLGSALSRMAASIWRAMSGCSLRKLRTLSLPCPTRSPA